MKYIHVLGFVYAVGLASALAAGQKVELPIGSSATLVMEIDESWQVQTNANDGLLNVKITPKGGGDFVLLLSVMPLPAESPISTPEGLKQVIQQRGKSELSGALQRELDLIEIKTPSGTGFIYHLTDRNPERGPGDYREAHQGGILLGSHFASVTLLTHTSDSATPTQVLSSLKTVQVSK